MLREVAMQAQAARYDRWKAPAEDGQVLIWPGPAQLLADARENHRRLADAVSVLLQGVPLSEVRREMRRWLGHEDSPELFTSGHQAELHHPGVWAKNVLIDAAARKLDGRALHFAVDTDEPKHLVLRWPGGSVPLVDDPAGLTKEWSGLVCPPSPMHLAEIHRRFNEASLRWSFRPRVPEFLDELRGAAAKSQNLPDVLTAALGQLDRGLGLRRDSRVTSSICSSAPYLLFVHHVLGRAGEFAADYNAVLAEYRRQNRIKSPGRPMPDLKVGADVCEVPFWLDDLAAESRSRATAVRSGGQWALRIASGDEVRFDPGADGWQAAANLGQWLNQRRLRLSPRALTLTAVLRLLAADQFVHGIGGGQYDQVLDALIARHLRLDPPRFSVTTATLYFPEAAAQPRACLPCVVHERHRFRHRVLGEEKRQLVEQIGALPRRSQGRSRLFLAMHRKLTDAWKSRAIRDWDQRLRETEARVAEERVLFDRELFYAIQPRERLGALIDQYRAAFMGH